MTEEELYIHLKPSSVERQILEKFFSQNVVIPKGKNRHPYADVLHKKLENIDLILESTRFSAGFAKDDCIVVEGKGVYILEYRIKQSEPVYEWQWYVISMGEAFPMSSPEGQKFFTEEEIKSKSSIAHFIKYEETKRERKQ